MVALSFVTAILAASVLRGSPCAAQPQAGGAGVVETYQYFSTVTNDQITALCFGPEQQIIDQVKKEQAESGKGSELLGTCNGFRQIGNKGPIEVELAPKRKKVRGSPDAPSGYRPSPVTCPKTRPTIRSVAKKPSLSDQEMEFLKTRRPKALKAYTEFLKRAAIPDFDAEAYIKKHSGSGGGGGDTARLDDLPNMALAMSGGGYRAMYGGAGVIMGFDERTPNATEKGHVGGLLQSLTYLSGLSGGSWLVGSLYSNNFPPVDKIRTNKNLSDPLWRNENSIATGPAGADPVKHWEKIISDVETKEVKGYDFNTSATDFWGRALAHQFFPDKDAGLSYTWSSVADDDYMKAGEAPLPILVMSAIETDTREVEINTTTLVEVSPFEGGSFNPTMGAFFPTKYLGSKFAKGELGKDEECIAGFDNAGFMMGVSSSLFNGGSAGFVGDLSLPDPVKSLVEKAVDVFSLSQNDIADISPNPFRDFDGTSKKFSKYGRLSLLDSGMDGQNIPLDPFLAPVRGVDVIIAYDASADTSKDWPGGKALTAAFQRRTANKPDAEALPMPITAPDADVMVKLGLNARPTFFGCNSTDSTDPAVVPPLIVYLPNAPYTYMSNIPTTLMVYSPDQRNWMMQNSYHLATQGNDTLTDNSWPVCLSCATLARSLERTGTKMPEACVKCFEEFCYDGSAPLAPREMNKYNPDYKMPDHIAAAPGGRLGGIGYLWTVLVPVFVSGCVIFG